MWSFVKHLKDKLPRACLSNKSHAASLKLGTTYTYVDRQYLSHSALGYVFKFATSDRTVRECRAYGSINFNDLQVTRATLITIPVPRYVRDCNSDAWLTVAIAGTKTRQIDRLSEADSY